MRGTVCIIGGGLGGLFCGALLAKNGYEVTVLEKNATIGGGLQSFRRHGELWDTGMHVIGGMEEGGNIRSICQYLGILDEIHIRAVDDCCTDSLYFAEDQRTYKMARGRGPFVDRLAEYFPEERSGIERYVDAIYKMTDAVDQFNLRPSDGGIKLFTKSEEFLLAADAFIAQYVSDPHLRSVLAYMNPLYGGRAGQTPAYIHAIISVLYINGTSRFVGGSQHTADLLARVITDHGGRVERGDAVEWIEVVERKVQYVRTSKGREYRADHYISAIHPCTMLRLMPESALPRSYRNRIDSIPNAYSAFLMYVKLKPCTFPYINHSEYYMTRYADIWKIDNESASWPLGFLMMTPPDENQGEWASKVLVTAPMRWAMVREWEATKSGHRGSEYAKWKEVQSQLLIDKIEEMHPGFRDCIELVETASPLTIRDYYGSKEGTISGFSKDCHNIALSQVPVVTKISNLLLTGQNNNLHGFCGVPLTAISTCEAIMGVNELINKINKCERKH